MIIPFDGVTPDFDPAKAWVAPNATLIGRVTLGTDSSIWFGAVLRGDTEPLVVGEGSNVQDLCVLHADPGFPLTIGRDVTVGHQAMLHGCTIDDGSLIGIQAVVLNGARIGKNCLIAAGAVVLENAIIPDNSLVVGAPGVVKRTLSAEQGARLAANARFYVERSHAYRKAVG